MATYHGASHDGDDGKGVRHVFVFELRIKLVAWFPFTEGCEGNRQGGGSDCARKTVQDGKTMLHGCGDCL